MNNFGHPPDAGHDQGPGSDVSGADADSLREVGESCSGPTDCIDGSLCIGESGGGFECMLSCPVAYDLCDDGSLCMPVNSGATAICYTGGAAGNTEPCTTNLDCDLGLLCLGTNGEFYCREACPDRSLSDGGCGEGSWCLTLSSGAGVCRSAVGSACATAADCPNELECSWDLFDVPALADGYCTTGCSSDSDCESGVCRKFVGGEDSFCMRTCQHRSDCRFNGSYDCLDASNCVGSSDPATCQTMFGDESLCLPGPL